MSETARGGEVERAATEDEDLLNFDPLRTDVT